MGHIPVYSNPLPSRGQSEEVFNANMVPLLNYLTELAPHINTVSAEMVALADVEVYSAAITYNLPDTVIGSDGMTYRCIGTGVIGDDPVGSATGDWVTLTLEGPVLPVGSVIGWPTSVEPTDFMEEDGSELSKVAYPALYAVLGTSFGETDGAGGAGITHFRLRDTRGLFKRIWDHGAGVDPDAASRTDRGDGTTGDYPGTGQGNQLAEHSHTQLTLSSVGDGSNQCARWNVETSSPNSISTESRPANINEMSIIKYQ